MQTFCIHDNLVISAKSTTFAPSKHFDHETSLLILVLALQLLTALLTGCSRTVDYPVELRIADSLTLSDHDSAVAYLDALAPRMTSAPEADIRINANHWMAGYMMRLRQVAEAYDFINEENRLKDSLSSVQSDNELAVANALYNYQLREQENMRLHQREERMQAHLLLAVLIALLLLMTVAVVIAYGHRRRTDLRDRNELLRFLLAAKAKEQSEAERTERDAQSMAALRTSEAVQLVTAKARAGKALNDADWEAVEQSLLAIIPDFLSRLRGVHSYSQVEWRMSVLTRMEVTVPDMSILLSRSKVTLYGMRKRLFQKVFPEGARFTDWQDFVMSL